MFFAFVEPPNNVTVYPILSSYIVGQTINCTANADPPATFQWLRVKTGEIFQGASVTLREDMVGYSLMRCTARNTIQGTQRTTDAWLDVYVERTYKFHSLQIES